jgi:nucleoside-diphosphate-sugar epimerase
MPTCLVTGGAGFLGSHLCEELLSRGNRVICVDNLDTGSLVNISHLRSDAFVFINVDITEPYFIDEPVDSVFHFASPASPIDYLRLPLHTLKVGSYGTHNTLGLAKRHRARFLTASTSEVYGDPEKHPQKESYWGNVNPIGPRGVYDEAKRYAEALTMAYHTQQASTPRWSGSSTPTARVCAPMTDGRSRRFCARPSRTSRSPCSGMDPRPGPSVTSMISCAGSSPCLTRAITTR